MHARRGPNTCLIKGVEIMEGLQLCEARRVLLIDRQTTSWNNYRAKSPEPALPVKLRIARIRAFLNQTHLSNLSAKTPM